jgi:uncharacterized membrane protein
VLKRVAIGILSFVVLDGLWLGLLMKSFYREHLAAIAFTAADGSLSPIWAAAAPVYLLMSLGIAVFVMPKVERGSLVTAARYGAVFGWILFGVYDLTNYSTLRGYSGLFAAVDTMWGGVTGGLTAVVMTWFGSARSA